MLSSGVVNKSYVKRTISIELSNCCFKSKRYEWNNSTTNNTKTIYDCNVAVVGTDVDHKRYAARVVYGEIGESADQIISRLRVNKRPRKWNDESARRNCKTKLQDATAATWRMSAYPIPPNGDRAKRERHSE